MRPVTAICVSVLAAAVLSTPASAATPRVGAKAARVVESDAAVRTVRVRLTLSRRAPAGARVRFRTRAGSAGADDFASRSGTVRFRRGSRRATIALRVRGDSVAEPEEAFSVRLFKARRVRLGRVRSVRVTIVDDDAAKTPVVAAVADAGATEPADPGSAAPHGLKVVLDRAATTVVRVDYEVAGGGLTTAEDVDLVRGTLTFAPGEKEKAVPGAVRGDALDELDETATVRLSNPVGALVADSQATLTIRDDAGDLPPSVSIADATVAETLGAARLSLTLSAPSGRSTAVDFATQSGTADAGDHATGGGRLTIAPGATSAEIVVPISNDPRDEDQQAFTVKLAQPDGLTLADGEATVAIDDDDPPPTVSIDDVSRQENAVAAGFTITLSAASEKTVTLRADTLAGTASGGASCGPGTDFFSVVGLTVTFTPGTLARPLDVTICEDGVSESDETATVQLSQLTNVTAGDPSGTLTIINDD